VADFTTELGRELLERVRSLPAAEPLMALPVSAPVHLVGGAVRDLLCDRAPRELDLAVEGDALALARALGGQLTVHDRFGTCTVLLEGRRYDLARTRRERYPQPGALPVIEPAPLRDDLRRRDFTVNAIALSLIGEPPGRLQAVEHALEDLRAGTMRVLHGKSFEEDPTRLLRLARYAARLDFGVEPGTRRLAARAAAGGALQTVSGNRIGAELRLLAAEEDPISALELLSELGIARVLLGGFDPEASALARRAGRLLPSGGRAGLLALAVASAGLAADVLRERLEGFGFPAGERELIVAAATRAGELARTLSLAGGPAQIAAAARGAPVELVALAGALGEPRAQAAARAWLERLRHVRLEISGEDLLAAGRRAGPEIGAGLRAALAAKLEGRVRGRDQELAEALRVTGGS
jgi:tRNA nucleotidyltransferase (CCA-adding enzyme)